MATAVTRHFPFQSLSAELRVCIYEYALLPNKTEPQISRGSLPTLQTLNFRYNCTPKMLHNRCHRRVNGRPCNDHRCRFRENKHRNDRYLEPVNLKDFAFGLFFTSRGISTEARALFYGQVHFVFDNRFDLKMFLNTLHRTAKYIKSLTFNWTKSFGPHSEEIKQQFKDWSLRYDVCCGPQLFVSIRELATACPSLKYLEMIDTVLNLPTQDRAEFRDQSYKEWTLVKEICTLNLTAFSYPSPSLLENTCNRRKAIERAKVASHVMSRLSTRRSLVLWKPPLYPPRTSIESGSCDLTSGANRPTKPITSWMRTHRSGAKSTGRCEPIM